MLSRLFRSPVAQRRWQRFTRSKRGYYSAWLLAILTLLSFGAEMLASNRALLVVYQGDWYLPTYSDVYSGRDFGLDYDYEVDYKALKTRLAEADSGFVLMPPIPYGPL